MSGARIEVAVATLGFDGFDDLDFEPAFALLPRTGFTNVEFNCWFARTVTPDGIERIAARSRAIAVRPVSLHLPAFSPGPGPDELARETARWLWLIEAASRLGVTVLKSTGRARGEGGGLPALIDLLRAIAPVAAGRGITLALENHAGNVLEFAADYDEVFAAVDDANVGLCLDTGHFVASGVDPVAVVDRFADRLVHVDLKDCAGPGQPFVPFGAGVADLGGVLDRAVAVGYRGFAVVEFPRRTPSDDTTLADLEAGADLARRHLPDGSNHG